MFSISLFFILFFGVYDNPPADLRDYFKDWRSDTDLIDFNYDIEDFFPEGAVGGSNRLPVESYLLYLNDFCDYY